ncbi:MAG: MarR family transcriptional regulator, partial [Bacteroidetes bacterium]
MTTSKCQHPEKYMNEDGSCAMCLANEGPQSCADIARRMGVSKQYVHQ